MQLIHLQKGFYFSVRSSRTDHRIQFPNNMRKKGKRYIGISGVHIYALLEPYYKHMAALQGIYCYIRNSDANTEDGF